MTFLIIDNKSLPLMRADFPVSGENVCKADKRGLEVDSPLGEDGGRETSSANSLSQSFASQKPAPSSEGALVRTNRICGGGAGMQAKEKSTSL